MNAIGDNLQTAGAQLSARAQAVGDGFAQLSARAGLFFQKVGSNIGGAAELIPTQTNKETRAARKIQKAWRGYAARGHFHEERGAVLMLQAAQRRVKAQKVLKYKQSLKYWAAVVIQERWRRYKLRQKAKELEAAKAMSTPTKKGGGGLGSKLVKSLSFSRRSAKKPPLVKPQMPDDITQDDLISARGSNPHTPMILGPAAAPNTPATPGTEPTGGVKKRSLSFLRRKKAAEAPAEAVAQNV